MTQLKSDPAPVLHFVCGKAASGKSTLATSLSQGPATVLIAEDAWLVALYGDQMATLSDYVNCAKKLRAVMGPHVVALLQAGTSVVLDFPANTLAVRAWMMNLAIDAGVAHQLHYLDVSDEVCKTRLVKRNAAGAHPFSLSEEQFDELARHFVAPTEDEGFTIVIHRGDEER